MSVPISKVPSFSNLKNCVPPFHILKKSVLTSSTCSLISSIASGDIVPNPTLLFFPSPKVGLLTNKASTPPATILKGFTVEEVPVPRYINAPVDAVVPLAVVKEKRLFVPAFAVQLLLNKPVLQVQDVL